MNSITDGYMNEREKRVEITDWMVYLRKIDQQVNVNVRSDLVPEDQDRNRSEVQNRVRFTST
jgi:hypothetical protein